MEENERLALATTLIRQHFPDVQLRTLRPIVGGWDSFVLDVDGELMFRFPLRDDVRASLQREVRLLPLLAPTLTTPVPQFRLIGRGDASAPPIFVGYPKLKGVAMEREHLSDGQARALVPALARFLAELHRFPCAQARQAGVRAHTAEQWRERYHRYYLDVQQRVFPLLPTMLRQRSAQLWENFLQESACFAFQPVLIHGDLAGEHLLCDPQRGMLTGVIDWGDVTIGDPALDVVGLDVQFGREFVEQVVRVSQEQAPRAFWRRMDFYRCFLPFSQVLYGIDEKRETFIQQGIAGLRSLFGA